VENKLPKIIVVLGPTASGKTDLALRLAKKYNGEIVSADSRQVYKKMNIGTAKPPGEWKDGVYVVEGVPHYMMDIVNPDEDFSLADFKTQATASIENILKKKKLPIIVGGTGLYIWTLVDNLDIPSVKPDLRLRTELEKNSLSELVLQLQELDPQTAEKIDVKNPRRVLRALEVAISSGQSFVAQQTKSEPLFNALQIGINILKEDLDIRIEKRVGMQMRDGLLAETETLQASGYDWNLPSMSGIGYRQIGYYLQDKMSLSEAVETLKTDTKKYAKRQITWFKRDKRIHWIKNDDKEKTEELIENFLKS
jgi:tRNA dimethylallyltransferase